MIPKHTLENPVSTADSRRTRRDDRAVSEILGAILLFALVVLLIALIQLNAVPAANQQVEFEHNQRVQGDLQEFEEVFLRSATTDTDGTVAIEAGTGYPSRFFLFNPPSPTGTVSVGDSGTIVIDNAVASGEAFDYLNGGEIEFATRTLTYTPNYNEYRNPPTTVYENGILYNEFENGQRVVSSRGGFVNGQTISLIALQGDFSTSTAGSLSVGTTPISAPAQEISVTEDTDSSVGGPTGPLSITLQTRLTGEEWREILADELKDNGGHVTVVDADPDDGEVAFEFETGVTYQLRTAAVGVGGGFDTETEEEYIVDIAGNDETVVEEGTQDLVVEVRDKYNNPVSNVEVSASIDRTPLKQGETIEPTAMTDGEGRATITYTAPDNVATTLSVPITVSFDGPQPVKQREVKFTLTAVNPSFGDDDGDDESGGNPINPTDVRLASSEIVVTGANCNGRDSGCTVDLEFENRGAKPQQIEELRISYYSVNNGPGSGGDYKPPKKVVIEDDSGNSNTIDADGSFQAVTLEDLGANGGTETYNFAFKEFQQIGGSGGLDDGIIQGDVFVVEVLFKDNSSPPNKRYVTYFVGPY